MSAPTFISIERRRYAALIDALKSATFALKAARIYHCGNTDNYVIARNIDRLLAESQEVRPCAN
jgi:hypothetical protein